MISRNAKKVLRYLKTTANGRAQYLEIEKSIGLSTISAKSACMQLIKKGYAEEDMEPPLSSSRISTGLFAGIRLTEEGRNRWAYVFESACSFLVRSILVPIVVSAITALVTLWLTSLLSTAWGK